MRFLILFFSAALSVSFAFAHTGNTGYSGAPGSRGTCAGSCHGSGGGTVSVFGFPQSYTPGQQYLITVRKLSGSTISNFNASCRIGTGSTNAGTLAAGTNTSTYSATGESNGIHFTSANHDSGRFAWTAPAAGTGAVRLYVAAHQGVYGGANTVITMTAQEEDLPNDVRNSEPALLRDYTLGPVYPNPFNATVTVPFVLPRSSAVELSLYDLSGRTVATLISGSFTAGAHQVIWNSAGISSGIYFLRLQGDLGARTRKVVALK
jgi:hypothetical protein